MVEDECALAVCECFPTRDHFHNAPFACFPKWVMWCDSAATRLSIVNHCFILKGVCLIFALCLLFTWTLAFKSTPGNALFTLSLRCSPKLFVFAPYHLDISYIHILIGTFAFDVLCSGRVAVSLPPSHTGPHRAFPGQEVAAFYWEVGLFLEEGFEGNTGCRTKRIN